MPQRLARKLLMIGWDAADWKLINPLLDGGLMPTLAKLVERGCIGNIATLRPSLSPMLWTSIATGKFADQHGITGFVEPTADKAGVRLVGSRTRRCKALWNITSEAGLRTHAIGWYASHPAEAINGVCVSDQFLLQPPDSADPTAPRDWICPADLAETIAPLRVSPRELGPADLLPFIPRLGEIDLRRDPRPGKLAEALAACAATHAVATDVLANHPWDVAFVYYDALDRIGHEFMPYHPPRMTSVTEDDFAHYQHVITGMYRFHDMLLDRLLQLAGDDATVMLLSDHGFHSDQRRPMPPPEMSAAQTAALWHRHYGILAIGGPGIRSDERVYGATLLDAAPTALALLGLPIGRDMPGRPLLSAFETQPTAEFVSTWESSTSVHPANPVNERDEPASTGAIRQLVDLGYLPPESVQGADLAQQAAREQQYNLGMVYLSTGRSGQAIDRLGPLVESCPREFRYVIALATAYASAGDFDNVVKLLEPLEAQGLRHPDVDVALANAWLKLGQPDRADEQLARLERSAPTDPILLCSIGEARLAQEAWPAAERAFRRAVELDDDAEMAHYGLARALLRLGRAEDAAEHALRAVGLVHGFPHAHFVLGLALEAMGDHPRAVVSIRQAIALLPTFREAHTRLAELLLQSGDVEQAMRHRRAADGHAG